MKPLFKLPQKLKLWKRSAKKEQEPPRLSLLDVNDPIYAQVTKLFDRGWLHKKKQKPQIQSIFRIEWTEEEMQPYNEYLQSVKKAVGSWNASSAQRLLFHGTRSECFLARTPSDVRLCHFADCRLCAILRESFDINRCGSSNSFTRFGIGIYTTSCSSKADDYVSCLVAEDDNPSMRTVLVSAVAVGKSYKTTKNCTNMVSPPHGSHSVLGVPGGDLNYEETVVYQNEAIRPMYLITYADPPPEAAKPEKPVHTLVDTPFFSVKTLIKLFDPFQQ